MGDEGAAKLILEWREKNKHRVEDKNIASRPWQDILADIQQWCDNVNKNMADKQRNNHDKN